MKDRSLTSIQSSPVTLGSKFCAALVLIAAFGVASCAQHDANSTDVTPPPPDVVVAKVLKRSVPINATFQGTTGSIESVEVRARVEGVLESAPFKEGSLVQKGQLIFTLQKQKYQANVLSAQGRLLKAQGQLRDAEQTVPVQQAQATLEQKQAILEKNQITLARTIPLVKDKALPGKDLDNATQNVAAAKADVDVAKANLINARVNQTSNIESAKGEVLSAQGDLANAKLNLSYTDIYAPVTGLIGYLKYDVGNVVGGTGTEVLDTIDSIDPIKVNFGVDQNTYLAVAGSKGSATEQSLRDQEVQILLANGKPYQYRGRLYTVNPTIDQKTGTINVEARFPNPEHLLRPGQFARVQLVTAHQPDAILVPQEAVIQNQGQDNVYVVDAKNVAELRTVQLGPQYGQNVLVRSGLSAGETVIVKGTLKAVPGQKVVPKAQ